MTGENTGFTNKEMLQLVMNDIKEVKEKLGMVAPLDARVKMLTKWMWGLTGSGLTIALSITGWVFWLTSQRTISIIYTLKSLLFG